MFTLTASFSQDYWNYWNLSYLLNGKAFDYFISTLCLAPNKSKITDLACFFECRLLLIQMYPLLLLSNLRTCSRMPGVIPRLAFAT